ncbi:MAG: DNA polymerase IV, partial [Patescibacteria group bacterium]|nr:DNA polymerase IV [Patescibacteria group bacterium]
FADITGLRRSFRTSYEGIARMIKRDLDTELGFTFSVGLAPNKVLAKVGSKWKKPSGLTVIPGRYVRLYLQHLPAEKIWGIGTQTAAYLRKFGIATALQFADRDETWVRNHLSKPFQEIWRELRGECVYPLVTKPKESYASIQKVKTFTPPSSDRQFIFSQLSKNIENACMKARRYELAASGVAIFLRTQDFHDQGIEISFSYPTSIPDEIIGAIDPAFSELYDARKLYRSTGVVLLGLKTDAPGQLDLFGEKIRTHNLLRLYRVIDEVREKYGKHTIYLGSSFLANRFQQHVGERGDAPERRSMLLKGETKRKRLGIPLFMGTVQ